MYKKVLIGGEAMEEAKVIETWFRLYERDITHYLTYYTGSADIEDYVQETFLKALHKIDSYQSTSHPKTWLISIARNIARDAFRKKNAYRSFLNKTKEDGDKIAISLECVLLLKEEQKRLYESILLLKNSYREIIYLKGILELNSAECGEILGWSTNKVNVTFSRALKRLRLIMGEDVNDKEVI